MWNLKHETTHQNSITYSSSNNSKGNTDLELNKLYNHIKMRLNEVTRLQGDLLPDYQYIKYTLSLNNNSSQIVLTLPII